MSKYLFIAGAPKSGTSLMFQILTSNKNISASLLKETNFFLDQNHPLLNKDYNVHKDGVGGFEVNFKDETYSSYRLEGSVHMMNQETPLKYLNELGDVKILFLLRDPIKRLESSFNFTKFNLSNFKRSDITCNDFVNILLNGKESDLQNEMKNGVFPTVLWNELSLGRYSSYIKKWIDTFSSKSISIIQYEKFVKNKKEGVSQIAEFLKLNESDFKIEIGEVNPTMKINSSTLHFYLKKYVPSFLQFSFIKNGYYKFQRNRNVELQELDSITLNLLKEYYKPFNLELKDLFKDEIDLNLWE